MTRRFNFYYLFHATADPTLWLLWLLLVLQWEWQRQSKTERGHALFVFSCEIVFFLSSFCILIVKRTASSEQCCFARGKLPRKTTAALRLPFSLVFDWILIYSVFYVIQSAHDAVSVGMWEMRARSVWNTEYDTFVRNIYMCTGCTPGAHAWAMRAVNQSG